MRIFVALEIAGEFRENILNAAEPLREKYPDFRWTLPGHLHITMAFLGETDSGLLPRIFDAVEKASSADFIHAGGGRLLLLPRGRPSVLAMGFDSGGGRISDLAKNVGIYLAERGIIYDDRKIFRPHITLARKGRTELGLDEKELPVPVNGDIVSLAVFESRLSAQGAGYIALASFGLKNR